MFYDSLQFPTSGELDRFRYSSIIPPQSVTQRSSTIEILGFPVPMPRFMPDERYFSIPSAEVGATCAGTAP